MSKLLGKPSMLIFTRFQAHLSNIVGCRHFSKLLVMASFLAIGTILSVPIPISHPTLHDRHFEPQKQPKAKCWSCHDMGVIVQSKGSKQAAKTLKRIRTRRRESMTNVSRLRSLSHCLICVCETLVTVTPKN